MRWALFFILAFTLFLSFSHSAFAYHPYVSTDAAVDNEHQWWLQTYLLDLKREKAVTAIETSSIDLSYGFMRNWDAGVTAAMQVYKSGEARNAELTDTSVYFDYQLRNGVLQNETGPSIMAETNILLPQTVEGERNVGFNTILAVSGEAFHFGYHLNAAVNFDQTDFNPGFIWGAILEYPFHGKFRIGVEFTGTTTYRELPDNQGTLGIIWDIGGVELNCAARKGLSEVADDWEVVTGFSLGWGQ